MSENGHRNGGWRNTVIGAFGGLSLLLGGWMLNEAATERRSMEAKIDANRNDLAEMKAEIRNLKVTVYEMRREIQQQGKR